MDLQPKNILLLANGNGEDSVAAAIAAKLGDEYRVDAYPLIGDGNAYKNICEVVGPRSYIPSEGWRHTSGSLMRDVKGGMLSSILPAVRFLRSKRNQYDKIVAVGDSVTPLLVFLSGLKIDIYLDIFKSGYAHKYLAVERWLIKRVAKKIYTRDDMLAKSLRDIGADAFSKGNIMLDSVPSGIYEVKAHRKKPLAITLLPGSRQSTAKSLAFQVDALRMLDKEILPDIFVAVAAGVSVEDLAVACKMQHYKPVSKLASDLGYLSDGEIVLNLTTGVLENIISASDLVLSQAGTATQQALGMARPVITFNRSDNRKKRMEDEQALMGEARKLVPQDVNILSATMEGLLLDKKERERLGKIGQQRLGGPGTLAAVVRDLAL